MCHVKILYSSQIGCIKELEMENLAPCYLIITILARIWPLAISYVVGNKTFQAQNSTFSCCVIDKVILPL